MAGLRQCFRQFARQKPAIELGQTVPRRIKLDARLNRPLLADSTLLLGLSKAAARSNPRVRPSVTELYFRLLRNLECIIDFDAQVSDSAFKLGMSEQ